MAKTKPYVPPHYADPDAYVADLTRELTGYRNRQAELRALGGDNSQALADAESGEQAVLEELRQFGHGQPAAAKRPAAPQQTRTSKAKGDKR